MNKIKQYQQISLANKLAKASNYEVVQMLLNAALQKIDAAKFAIENNNLPHKVKLVNQVIEIVESLNATLNYEAGEIAHNFHALYRFILDNLMLGNVKNSVPNLQNAEKILRTIKESWDDIKSHI